MYTKERKREIKIKIYSKFFPKQIFSEHYGQYELDMKAWRECKL